MINKIKPFYVYEENNCLYVKNINEKIEKLSNNIITYCANFDDNNIINICSIDAKGALHHFIYRNGKFRKKFVCKVCNNTKSLKNMRLFIIKNFLNIFLIEESSIEDNLYRVSHFNFNPNNYNTYKYHINNIVKEDECIYKLNVDNMHNMIFSYNTFDRNSRSNVYNQTLIFNSNNRKWLPTHNLLRNSYSFSEYNNTSYIKDDLFEYCYSIIYNE